MSRNSHGIDRREALILTTGATALAMAPAALGATASSTSLALGRNQPFDTGWLFARGTGTGFEDPGLDDSHWRGVDLPHDWSIEDLPGGATGPFDKQAEGGKATGFTQGGEGWYRKHFRLENAPPDARVEIAFDGIYLQSEIWLNGHKLGGSVSGYRPFALDLTPFLKRSGKNVLAVRVRNLGLNSRWYSGSGLYRQVKLDVLPAGARVARWGVAAWTRRIAGGRAEIDVTTRLENADPAYVLITRLRDPNGRVVQEVRSPASAQVNQALIVRAPRLWSPASPALYALETELRHGDIVVDRMDQSFGIRIVTLDPVRGLAINGTAIKLRGGCVHHDNGLLGACAFPDADARRVRLLKARGFNAIRSSHNPISRSLREACDRLGMLVIDEAFDAWHAPKLPQDTSVQFKDHWHEVIEAMVLSGRNSPSVIMWSIGNEIPDRSTEQGVEWQWKLANAVKQLDRSRPVTSGLNGVLGAPMIAREGTARPGQAGKLDQASTIFLDVAGYNYRLADIEAENTANPDRLVIATETFPKEVFDYAALMDRAPYFLGEFVWTAMDYLGEAGLVAAMPTAKASPMLLTDWPWVGAWCGDIDLIGGQKAQSRARDVAWGLSVLEMNVRRPLPAGMVESISPWGWSDELASWTWPGSEGQPMMVRVYSRADKVQLLLNGRQVDEKALSVADKYLAEFTLPYAAGKLEAVAWRGGKAIARRKLETAGAPARLRLVAEERLASADRQSLCHVRVEILDAQGQVLPDEQREISLSLEGPADLAGFGSANPLAIGSYQSKTVQSFRGQALAIVRSRGTPGPVRITAHSKGLSGGSILVQFG